ncbi:hypothetical protein MKW94_005850, partial [Papaver nudicaule]|nr:hypothetical protein [Papaver nudicaule]
IFEDNYFIYSAKAVRFRIGHVKEPQREKYIMEYSDLGSQTCIEDHVVWTYTSEKFPMVQESCLQSFKLPEPVLAMGGLLQIELLGRVQLSPDDGLYYLWLVFLLLPATYITHDIHRCTLRLVRMINYLNALLLK